jgi:hypothetical protein
VRQPEDLFGIDCIAVVAGLSCDGRSGGGLMIAIAALADRWPLNRAKCDNTNGGGHFRRSDV